MPVDRDVRLGDGEHVVQFYEAEDALVGVVVGYLTAAVLDGDAVIVIGTSAHCDAFQAALSAAGVDVHAAQVDGRLVLLDAAGTLARFMVDGRPDFAAFEAVVGGVVREAAAGGRRVRAYGEMVALLWDAGNVAGAIELERLWNGLGDRVPFSLFCAYPAHAVAGPQTADSLTEVCHLHSKVLAGTAGPAGQEAAQTFSGDRQAPRLARRFLSDTLRHWNRADLIDDGALVVSELVTNAVMHADSEVTFALSRRGPAIRLVVADTSVTEPVPRDPGPAVPSGRGLQVVDAVASRWGHRVEGGKKFVWAELGADVT